MKYFIKTIYLILVFVAVLLFTTEIFAKDAKLKYSEKDISNYFSGIVSLSQNNVTDGFKYLNKVYSLRNKHTKFNIRFIHSLILLEKFDHAFAFSKSIWNEDEYFFEVDLLLGLDSFIKKD